MKPRSLRKQLILSLCISLAILCVIGNFAVFSYIKKLDLQEFDKELINQLQTLVALTHSKEREYDFQKYLFSDKTAYYQLWSNDRKVLARSLSLKEHELPVIDIPLGQVEIRDISLPGGQKGRMAALTFIPETGDGQELPGSNPDNIHQQVQLAFAKSREDLDHILNLELSFSLLIGGILIASAACVVFILVNRSFQIFGDFAEQIQSIDPRSLFQRLRNDNLPAELIPFCDQFNSLMESLEASFTREKRFNANIAHELRTPIAELRVLNEVAIQEIDGSTLRQSFRSYFEDALQLTARMERVVEVLTLLNQLETEQIKPATESFSLDAVIHDAWHIHAREAEEKKMICSFQIPEHIKLHSDRALISAIVDNVISNAIVHSPKDSAIVCRVHSEGAHCRFELSNPSKDLSAEDLHLLSEPFWQKDPSRTSTKHVGLGLTLVEAYCKILSITVEMRLEPPNLLHALFLIPNLSGDGKPLAIRQPLFHVPTNVTRTSLTLMFFLGGLLILFSGCANPSVDYSPAIDGIERHTGFRSGLKDTPDKTLVPEEVSLKDGVSLEEAIALALWNNAAFQEALSGLGLSQADVIQANMLQNPQFWGVFPTGPSPAGPLEFAVRFPLEALWLRPYQAAAAQHKLDQAVEGLIQNGLTLVRDVKVAFINVLLAEERLALTVKHAEILQQIAQITESRWQAGEISEFDAGTARIDALQGRDQFHQLTQEVDLIREQFRVLIGLGHEDSSIVLQNPSTLPTTQRSVEELLTDALATRPDLRAAESKLEAAGQRVGLARKEIFVLTGIYRAQQSTTDPFNSRPGIQFTIPIFNQNQGGIALAEAGVEVAARRYVTVRDQIVLEVRQAHTRWFQNLMRLENWQQRTLPAHRTAAIQAQKALEAGDVTPLLPLAAQRNWIQAQVREFELIADQRRAIAELERAIGHSLNSQPHRSPQTQSDPS